MKASFIVAALLAAAPVFAAIQDSHHGHNARAHHVPKSISKAHRPSRRGGGPAKRARCAAQSSQSSSSLLSASSTVSTASTASTHSVAATTTIIKVEVPTTTTHTHHTTTSTKEVWAPATTTKKTESSNNSGSGGSSGSGSAYSGDGTYYAPGLNACGTVDSDSDYIAAASHALWDSMMVDGDSNDNPICQKKAVVTYLGSTITVRITDKCMGCDIFGSLDFSPSAFAQLVGSDYATLGRVHNISWKWA